MLVVITVLAALELVSATTDCILIGLDATASRALPSNNIMVANDSVLGIKFLLFIKDFYNKALFKNWNWKPRFTAREDNYIIVQNGFPNSNMRQLYPAFPRAYTCKYRNPNIEITRTLLYAGTNPDRSHCDISVF